MKRILSLLLILILMLIPLSGCGSLLNTSGKIQVIATLFPQYDFIRNIGGDKVEVTLLLPAGQESHLYDPSPSDMAKIASCNLFVYTGDNMEGWAGEIASSVSKDVNVLNLSKNINLYSHSHGAEQSLDPHIWLDIDNAKKMCDSIAKELCAISPENSDFFNQNLESYKDELTKLDEDLKDLFKNGQKHDLIFGGRFALGYLTRRYNISYQSAYSSCSANSEPSVQDIANLCDYVKANNIKVVYAEEFADPKVAREIASSSSAEVLVLHSCHNTSLKERESGATYISLMRQNLENLRKGIN